MGLQSNSRDVQDGQVRGKVGYTIVGSPTVTDGIASGFSANNLLQCSSTIAPQNITERVVRIKFNQSAIGSGRYHNVFYGPASMSFVFYSGSNDTTISTVSCYLPGISSGLFKGALGLTANTWYWFKYTYDGTTASLYMSSDGDTYTLLNSVTGTISGNTGTCYIGNRWNGDSNFFDGELDLNKTYMKSGRKIWFWQPQPCKKVYYNGVLVWEYVPPYTQNWSDNQPSQHNTPVPLDAVGLTTGIISAVETDNLYEVSQGHNDTVGLTTGLIGAVETDNLYETSQGHNDTVGLTTGIISAVEEDVIL